MGMIGLGIESSCDETSVALVRDGREIIADLTFSQIEMHAPYQGIVPEMASRAHMEKFPYLLKEAFSKSGLSLSNLDYVAVTMRPGLVGSLLTGFVAAKTVAALSGAPIVPIHHLEAHLYAVYLEEKKIEYPSLGYLISGGNSALYEIVGLGKLKKLADTVDDAAGEALDKAASLLGLSYPGGPSIEKAARKAADKESEKSLQKANPLPRIMKRQGPEKFMFSFSGLKTALLVYLQKNPLGDEEQVHRIAYWFQERLVEHLADNLRKVLAVHPELRQVVVAGGVSANSKLRNTLETICAEHKTEFLVPRPALCTDNAAMVAALGFQYFEAGKWPVVHHVSSTNQFFNANPKESEAS